MIIDFPCPRLRPEHSRGAPHQGEGRGANNDNNNDNKHNINNNNDNTNDDDDNDNNTYYCYDRIILVAIIKLWQYIVSSLI